MANINVSLSKQKISVKLEVNTAVVTSESKPKITTKI